MNYLNLVGTTDRYRIKQGYRSIRHRSNERLLYIDLLLVEGLQHVYTRNTSSLSCELPCNFKFILDSYSYRISWSIEYLSSVFSKENTVSALITLSGREFQRSTTLLLKEYFLTSVLEQFLISSSDSF